MLTLIEHKVPSENEKESDSNTEALRTLHARPKQNDANKPIRIHKLLVIFSNRMKTGKKVILNKKIYLNSSKIEEGNNHR